MIFSVVYKSIQASPFSSSNLAMKLPNITLWLVLFIFAWVFTCFNTHFVSSQCLDDQKSLLLQLRNSFQLNPILSTRLSEWNKSIDCCQWRGVECDPLSGLVVALDLSEEWISGHLNNSNSLFHLHSLQSLNLAYNFEISGQIPSAISQLTSLTYLNLSTMGFNGQVPIEISHLVKLVTLDLSNIHSFDSKLHIASSNLAMITGNLTNIKELYLDGVVIISDRNEWWEMFSSSLPRLQVLSMSSCELRGEILPSLAKLHSLSVLRLDENNLSAPFPESLAKLKNLTVMSLSGCGLIGKVPKKIFLAPKLTTLDLSFNYKLQGTLPDFREQGSLQTLLLSSSNFSGWLLHSIGYLKKLRKIDISGCNFDGVIPISMGSLNQIEFMDLSSNHFSGQIPSFSSAKKLTNLILNSNSLSGSITTTDWGSLLNLERLDLSKNSLTGSIPTSLLLLPSLSALNLAQNQFNGQLNEFASLPSYMLSSLDLSKNKLEGPIPKSIFQLRGLTGLDLSWNRFNGTLELNNILLSLMNLTKFSLSYNYLSINANNPNTTSDFPQLFKLGLASCNLSVLPKFLKNQSGLADLDLSKNQIQGEIPIWIWNVSDRLVFPTSLNLSCNHFVNLEKPLPHIPSFNFLDVHSNNLKGQLPIIPWPSLWYLDCSNNSFTSISTEIGDSLPSAAFLFLSKNKIEGPIPSSLCKPTSLQVLDLEYNHLNGTIPDCLIAMTRTLRVLNLRGNKLHGVIPDKFVKGCVLESFKANLNFLHGQIPRSLANCHGLTVLDLGSNKLNDRFPCHLESLSSLQVLVLRSNELHGTVICLESHLNWSSLQIFDLASNHFNGQLSTLFVGKWGKMMAKTEKKPSKLVYLEYYGGFRLFDEQVDVTYKGFEFSLVKILSIFTSIDFSNNYFHGKIPIEIGNLIALKGLNLSHNLLSGKIPPSIGNLNQIESLDLSCNILNGNIPQQLASLNFLEYLNLSFNKLSGKIPKGTQLQSFEASSYEGNQGLYGPPLTPSGTNTHDPGSVPSMPPHGASWSFKDELEWMLKGAEVGFPVGITLFLGPLLYIKRWRRWYSYQVDRVLMKVLPREGHRRRTRRGRASGNKSRDNRSQ